MNSLDKIFHRQKHPYVNIRIFDQNSLLTNTNIKKIRQRQQKYLTAFDGNDIIT